MDFSESCIVRSMGLSTHTPRTMFGLLRIRRFIAGVEFISRYATPQLYPASIRWQRRRDTFGRDTFLSSAAAATAHSILERELWFEIYCPLLEDIISAA